MLPLIAQPGRIYTADALHTQVKWMQVVHDCQAFTVLTVKDNQPTLLQDMQTYFADPHVQCAEAETWDRRRGRVEHRSIRVSSEMNAYLHATWPHIRQVAQLTRVVTSKHGTSTQVVYLITNLSAAQASPERLLAVVHGATGRLRMALITFVMSPLEKEDRSRLRSGNAPQVLAALRNLAITLIHRTGTSHIAATRRTFSHDPALALDLLFRCWIPQQ